MDFQCLQINALFDLRHTLAAEYLFGFSYPWEALGGIEDFLTQLSGTLGDDFTEIERGVLVHGTAKIAPTAHLSPPCIICAGAQVRHGAYIRGGVLVGENCVVGNSVELKNCILFDGVQVPHFNYVGDSILGYRSHLGAGAITSNVKADRSPVVIKADGEKIPTGRYKVGAFLGDHAEVGCNAVLNPGTVIGRHTAVYPLVCARGCYPADSIVKHDAVLPKYSSES